MRHPKVAQTPGQTRNDFLPAGKGAPVGRRNGGNRVGVQHRGGKDRGNEHCAENQHPLEKVGPADRGKPTQEGVADNDDGGDIHGQRFVEPDDGVEEGAAGLDARGRVDGVGDEEDGGSSINEQKHKMKEQTFNSCFVFFLFWKPNLVLSQIGLEQLAT